MGYHLVSRWYQVGYHLVHCVQLVCPAPVGGAAEGKGTRKETSGHLVTNTKGTSGHLVTNTKRVGTCPS